MTTDVPVHDSLRRRLAAAVETFARQRGAGAAAGSVAVVGPLPADAEQTVRAAVPAGELVRRDRPAALAAEPDRACALVAATALPGADGAAEWSRHAARVLLAGGRLLLEIPAEARAAWQTALAAEGFGEFRTRAGAATPLSGERELMMARLTAVRRAAQSPAAGRADPAAVRARVAATLERVLRLSPGDLDGAAPFSDYGVDSIVGVAFVNELNRTLGLDLKPMVLFDHTSVDRLARFVAEQCEPRLGEAPGEASATLAIAPRTSAEGRVPTAGGPEPRARERAQQDCAPTAGTPVAAGDIAVVGMAGRFPGADDVAAFWNNLRAGVNAITEVPADRWDHSRVYDPQARTPDKTPFKWGGFLADADKFDPLFFAISGREAEATDPQQRVFLEECYHALEDAGYAGASASRARKCGVFAGVEPGDYLGLFTAAASAGEKAPLFQGNAESILAARISYFLDLKGPSLAINTACSSSLVAIHLACESLRRGECDLALAGGVRVFATEKAYLALGNMGMLAADGRCKTFDAAADGFVPGEAAGVLVLKPLAAALRDGDTIRGVIKGSAINQDGRTNGITAPSGLAQTEVHLEAYARAGVGADTIQYVEAHGTGTRLGDPIEVQALTNAFRRFTPAVGTVLVGSVKTNIGHTMAAAGVCSVIKVLQALRAREIPPSLHLAEPNPYIDFATSPFRVASALSAWPEPAPGQPRRAAISSFGFSGTNSHLVLEEPPATAPAPAEAQRPAHLVVLSARTPEALTALLRRTAAGLADGAGLADVAFTLAVGRAHFEERCAVVATSVAGLRDDLARLADGATLPNAWRGNAPAKPDAAEALIHRQLAAMALGEAVAAAGDAAAYRDKLAVLGALYVKGTAPVWETLFPAGGRRVPLPGYPFARERYWAPQAGAAVSGVAEARLHPLVHRNISTLDRVQFATRFTGEEFFLRDHVVNGKPTLPGVAYLEMAVAAARAAGGAPGEVTVTNLAWLRPLTVTAPTDVTIRLQREGSGASFAVVSGAGEAVHAEGRLRFGPIVALRPQLVDLAAVRARCAGTLTGEALAERCRTAGLILGAGMRAVREIRFSDTEALSRLELDEAATDDLTLHPALLDGALQTTAALGRDDAGGLPVPFAVAEVTFGRVPRRAWAHVERQESKGGLMRFRVRLLDDSGAVVATLAGLAMRALRAAAPAVGASLTDARALPAADDGHEPERESSPAGRGEFLVWLTARFSELVKLPAARIQPQDALEKFGIDSVMVMDFTQRLETDFGELSKTLLFEHQTLGELADYFLAHHTERVAGLVGGSSGPRPPSVASEPAGRPGAVAVPPEPDPGDIAIIGVAGRYPMADDLEAFWQNLRDGRDCIVEIPPERWDWRAFYDAEPGKPGKTRNKWGGFIDGIERFDAAFFGVTPREAIALDPQERLFLQTAWQTLESAGYPRAALTNRAVGVFVGVMYGEYQLYGAGDVAAGRVAPLSSSYASIANRVSYFFNWHGPSLAVDTMCSSSLTAIHLACQSLRSGETELALAGGVNATVHPHKDMLLAPGGFAASDGRCRSFGEGGDGYVPGEGVGALLLKPLARALADGDPIWGVVKASAVNHGGKTNGYTVPNPKSQAEVVATALARAGVAAGDISYIEAHGTGTSLGDPIEIAALTKAFGPDGAAAAERGRVRVGSVKSNIGHLESAAGVAGVTKVLLQLKHGQIAPSLHSRALNPNINFGTSPFRVPQTLEPWTADPSGAPRRAGVSSFGAGGSNAHVVIEEFAAARPDARAATPTEPRLFVLSAKTEERLAARARQLADFLGARPSAAVDDAAFLADVAWTLQVGRDALEERLAFVAASASAAAATLRAFAAAAPGAAWARGRVRADDNPATAATAAGELAAVAQAWVRGAAVDWAALPGAAERRRIPLPVYPFAGDRFWAPDKLAAAAPAVPLTVIEAPRVTAPPPAVATAESIFLRPVWREAAATETPVGATGRLLVFESGANSAPDLAARYPQLAVTRVVLGTAYAERAGEIAIDPAADDGYRRLVAAAPPTLVIHRWAEAGDVAATLDRGFRSLGRLTQALMARGVSAPVRIAFCHPPATPQHAAVAAWARTLAQEQPNLRVVTLETDGSDADVLAELLRAPAAREVRLAGGRREVLGFAPLAVPASSTVLKERGVYLVTGGLGGIGRLLARHLAETYRARLLLTGRSAATPETERVLHELRAAGGEAVYFAGDVAQRADAFAAAAAARSAFGRIDGVIHAAGVLRDGFLLKKTAFDYAAVLAPKVPGTVWLDAATAGDALDFFALFSSTAGVFGNVGQGDYAFANAFLDAFAETRAAQVRAGARAGRTVAIAWPLWREGGMPLGRAVLSRLAQAGLEPLPAEVGLAWFERVLGADAPRVVGLWGDRARVVAQLQLGAAAEEKSETVTAVAPAAADLTERIEAYLRETLGAVIQLPADRIDPEQRFDEIGVDSIVVNDVNQRFERDLGAVPKTLLFEHPNIRRLASHLAATQAEAFARLWGGAANPAAHAAGYKEESEAKVALRVSAGTDGDETPAAGDIAIIGLAGRFPGAPDADRFWEVLRDGRSCVTEVPASRWNLAEHFDPDPEKAIEGKMYGRWGAFLEDTDKFDPLFFNLSPVEAEMMDPQERLFLEVAWHTLEDAGVTRRDLRRWVRREFAANVGVFVGVTSNGYALLGHEAGGPRAAPTTLPWSLANRVSYLFNFNGPSLPVDTACSSSLTAIHLAVQAIRRGECQQAIAGGVNLYLHPSKYSHLSLMKMLSTDGRCRAFGDGGDGFVPGEGAGAVLLKPLALALADGDRIHGVIKATAVNHGGRTNGYTVPNPAAQADLVAQALAAGRIEPASISYIEAHGTGTALGDPIEVEGLARAFAAAAKTAGTPLPPASCALGSVKTNIGHLESASGIAGLAKVLLQLRHGQLAPSLHASPPNPRIDFAATPFRVQTALAPWTGAPRAGGGRWPRRAGISSFGAGGANAHVIVEEAPARAGAEERVTAAEETETGNAHVIVLSAKNRDRLRAIAANLKTYLETAPGAPRSLAGIAWTLQTGREALEERVAFVVSSRADLLARLDRVAADHADENDCVRGRVKRERVAASSDEGATPEAASAGDLRGTAQRWVSGSDLDWRPLYPHGEPARVGLPGYAFARERYWIPALPAAAAIPVTGSAERVTHLAADAPVLAHHVVHGRAVLPGAATLELARAALLPGPGVGAIALRNVVWQRPIVGGPDGATARISVRRENGAAHFEIRGATGDDVLVQGSGVPATMAVPARVDVAGLWARCPQTIAAEALYAGFAARGIRYGEAFQVIRRLACGHDEAVAELVLPALWPEAPGALPPALVDGALQCLGAIGAGQGGLEIPFSVTDVTCFEACPRTVIAHVRVASAAAGARRYDLHLLTPDGRVAVALQGVCVRRFEEAEPQVLFGRVGWTPAPARTARFRGTVFVLDDTAALPIAAQHPEAVLVTLHPDDDFDQRLGAAKPDAVVVRVATPAGVGAFHRIVRAILRRGGAPVPTVLAYPETVTALAALDGYARSVRREHPGWALSTLCGETTPTLDAALTEIGAEENDVRLCAAGRERRTLAEMSPASPAVAGDGLRRGGVYVITGGLGGLGRHFADHLVRRWDATVVLAGRSEPGAAQATWLAQLGARAAYVRADLAEPGAAEMLLRTATERFGRIDGVLHAAGALRDGLVRDRTDDDFAAVAAAKVGGALALHAAARRYPFAWLALFSSTAGVFGNAGQSVYAWANRQLDLLAAAPRAAGGPRLISIAWPLWRDGGMQTSAEALRAQAGQLGLHPLETAEGLAAFERIVASGETACLLVKGEAAKLRAALAPAAEKKAVPVVHPPTKDVPPALVDELRTLAAKVLRLDPALLDPDTDTGEYGFDSVTFTSLANEITRAFGVEATPAVFFEHRTLAAFAKHLWTEHPAQVAPRYAAVAEVTEAKAEPETVAQTETQTGSTNRPYTAPGAREPVAIIGMSGVFPGSPDLETFWKNLEAGRDLVGKPAPERWVTGAGDDAPWGGFIDDIDKFDALFFDISPREAELMDPQQRIFLQTVWRTLEDAGYRKTELAGTKTGLFVGVAANDYANVLAYAGVEVEAYSSTGNAHSVLANRVSYFFDLRGPSEAIDTACSSSLVAIHRAIESLESGSSDLAIVGGVNALLSPAGFTAFTRAGMLSPGGRCKSFDARADGYVRGEGVGALLLKPLSRAVRDGDRIYATIIGSAENHGGHVQSLTVPNPNAQAQLLQDAWARAGIAPATLGYIEAHGTGTALGDPIEINGLKKAFAAAGGDAGAAGARCAVGSVKTNIGHLETAAGIAGMIKVLLALRHRRIPGSVHLQQLNPYIRTEGTPFHFPTAAEPWPAPRDAGGRPLPRRAGVSSFGFGGANAHIVLEEYAEPEPPAVAADRAELIVLSARDRPALAELAGRLRAYLETGDAPALPELARGLQLGREALAERAAFAVRSRAELAEVLAELAAGRTPVSVSTGNTADNPAATRLLRQLHGDAGTLAPWLAARDFEKLAPLWTASVNVDWRPLHGAGPWRRVRLPGYPFARVRHWVPAGKAARPLAGGPPAHPLLRAATPALRASVFAGEFAVTEPLLGDHIVEGRPILPAAAVLELFDGAVRTATGSETVRLRNVAWLQPVTADAAGAARVTVRLGAVEAQTTTVELVDPRGDVLARGTAAWDAPAEAETVDLAALRARCPRSVSADDLYAAFAQRGLRYGPAYRVIRDIAFNDTEVWSRLELPAAWNGKAGAGFRLHPALLDGALQALAVLGGGEALEVPFAVAEVISAAPLPAQCGVHAQLETAGAGHRTFRVSLTDERGAVVARLGGYAVRRFAAPPAAGPVYLVPEWVPAVAPSAPPPPQGTCLVFADSPELAAALQRAGVATRRVVSGSAYRADGDVVHVRRASREDCERLLAAGDIGAVIHHWAMPGLPLDEGLERGLHSVHALTQAWLKVRKGESAPLLFVHPPGEPVYEAVAGYAKSVRHEHPGVRWKTLATEAADARVLGELTGAPEDVRWTAGRREVRSLRAWTPPASAAAAPKHDGVYLITGGAGGLGLIFAEHFLAHGDARLVLAGRSAPDAALRRRLAAWGGRAVYVAADVATAAGAEAAVREARMRFGRLDGVLHAAGVLRDGLVWHKRREDFEAVLAPKLRAAEALDAATRGDALEWFVLCSSSVGLLGNAGQSDYAFANACLDAFAHRRAAQVARGERTGRTLALNWPLWRDGGMKATKRADALGLMPLERAAGLEIFERALAGTEPQVWGFVGHRERVRQTLLGAVSVPAAKPAVVAAVSGKRRPAGEIAAELTRLFAELSKVPAADLRPTEPLEKYGLDSILAVEFSRAIGERYGEVSQAIVFEHPSIAALSEFLAGRGGAAPASASQPPSVPRPVSQPPFAVPAVSVPRPRRQLALAPIDYLFVAPKRLAMQVLYYFERPLDFAVLRKGLHRAAEAFFPVNARLGRRGSRSYVIRECADEPDFCEVLCDAGTGVPVEGDAASLDPFRTPFDPTQRGEKLAKFRLHQLRHGSILAVNVSHAIADGYSFYYFMSAWASACRGEPFLAPDHTRGVLRQLARGALAGGDAAADLPVFGTAEPRTEPFAARVETRSFDTAALVDEARRKAGPMEQAKLSENSVLTAHVWKHYAAALAESARDLTLACPVNFRRQSGRFSHAFFGNASAPAVVRLARAQVLEASVPALAAAITDAVRGCDERTLAQYHAAVERLRLKRGLGAVRRTLPADPAAGLVVTNVARFPLPPVDFGTGPCADDFNLRHYAGTAVIVPGRGDTLKVRIGYPPSTAAASAVA